jgi:2-oxoglutarate ferredoxin oxidoreductase subunit alpha
MSPETLTKEKSAQKAKRPTVVNDIVIEVATSNGTGSQSANNVLMRSIFQMGVPVGGKNLFPSNIQGLPTWFTIRANKDGWTARRKDPDLLVAMNVESIADDIKKLRPGAVLVLNSELKSHLNRDDLITYIVPFNELVGPVCPEVKLRRYVANMIYTGVVAWLLEIDIEEVQKAIVKQFPNKPKAVEINKNAAQAGYNWAAEHLDRNHGFKIERMHKTDNKILIDGNHAAAMGFLFGGVQVVGWYPITPSTDMAEALTGYLEKYRNDPETGKATFAVVQAEDEIASIGFVVGAGWAGARAMTTTSGPGISLMAEFAGLAYYAEIPAVIADVQRMGPSTGLPTRTSQGDILKAYYLSHGDCKHILLIPASVEECYEFAAEALNLAERFQTLVFLMMDLDLGMNVWMSDPFQPITKPIDRGKVLTAEDLERIGKFARYADVDGDGIPYRTLPGTKHPLAAYFTRGTGHTEQATYSEKPEDWQKIIERLAKKHNTARKAVPEPVIDEQKNAEFGIVAYGSSDPAVEEARALLKTQHELRTNYMRMRALPANDAVRDFIAKHRAIYLVEQNRDAQMAAILRAEWPELATKLRSVLHYNGLPIDAATIVETILAQEKKG